MTQIDFNTSPYEDAVIEKIVARAVGVAAEHDTQLDVLTATMDLTAAHRNCSLDLERLLTAERFTFNHDVFGIFRHLNRKTGKLGNCFLPRMAINRGSVMLQDQVFTIRHNGEQVWQVCLAGKVLPATWNSKGAAQAGLEVERRRLKIKELQNERDRKNPENRCPAGGDGGSAVAAVAASELSPSDKAAPHQAPSGSGHHFVQR